MPPTSCVVLVFKDCLLKYWCLVGAHRLHLVKINGENLENTPRLVPKCLISTQTSIRHPKLSKILQLDLNIRILNLLDWLRWQWCGKYFVLDPITLNHSPLAPFPSLLPPLPFTAILYSNCHHRQPSPSITTPNTPNLPLPFQHYHHQHPSKQRSKQNHCSGRAWYLYSVLPILCSVILVEYHTSLVLLYLTTWSGFLHYKEFKRANIVPVF